jgi:hypothetical protein
MSRFTSKIIPAAFAALLGVVLAGCSAQSGPKKPRSVTPPNFESLTPPQSLLREDTIEAGTHDRSSSRLAYVGVWAVSGDACAMMDQTAFEGYAVITPGSLRHPDETCSFDAGAPGQAYSQFEASCKVGRKTLKRMITVDMATRNAMRLTIDGRSHAMTRCHLPK